MRSVEYYESMEWCVNGHIRNADNDAGQEVCGKALTQTRNWQCVNILNEIRTETIDHKVSGYLIYSSYRCETILKTNL